MSRKLLYSLVALVALSLSVELATAQRYPERRMLRKGNREYKKGNFNESEVDYMRALEKNPELFEGYFNYGNALYKQGRYEEALEMFENLGQDAIERLDEEGLEMLGDIFYNAGNSLLKEQNYKGAIEHYKNALRVNPSDQEAKFNLAYAKKFIDDDEDGGGGDNDDQQNDQDQEGDGDGDDDKDDQGDQDKDDQGDGDQNKDNQEQEGDGKEQPQEGKMNREEAEQLLNALQSNENKTREKVDAEKAAQAVKQPIKNW